MNNFIKLFESLGLQVTKLSPDPKNKWFKLESKDATGEESQKHLDTLQAEARRCGLYCNYSAVVWSERDSKGVSTQLHKAGIFVGESKYTSSVTVDDVKALFSE